MNPIHTFKVIWQRTLRLVQKAHLRYLYMGGIR